MKKLISLLLVLAMVMAMAAPALAMSSTMRYVEEGGKHTYINGQSYIYYCKTGGSTTRASGQMTYEKAWNMIATLNLTVTFANISHTKSVSNLSSGNSVSVSTTNSITVDNSEVDGTITEVHGKYILGNRDPRLIVDSYVN